MPKISVIAKLTAAEGKSEELESALRELIAAAAEEPGLEVYSVHRDEQSAGVYHFFEMYADEDALKVHGRGERMKPLMKGMAGLVAGPPEVTMLSPVAAKGLSV